MNELDPEHRPLAQPDAGSQTPPSLGNYPGGRGAEHGVRGGTGAAGDHPRDTRPDRATRFVETARGILSYAQLAPLLAERVTAAETEIYREVFQIRPLDESLLLDLHARVCGDLVPDWAGRWRSIEVVVGKLRPPPAYSVAGQMRDYALDLQARWPEAARMVSDLTLEFLSCAEGRFLAIHPFQDFNGRTIRLFLLELLRRLDLPRVVLAVESAEDRAVYFAALESADQADFRPLMEIWRQRFTRIEPVQPT
ncbi:MAG TPA: Fic family protein [Verrucomicrobiae bacterium]